MNVTRGGAETATGPSESFTGDVYIDTIATPSGPSRLNVSSVHFTPGARTAWHAHPNGQTIYVTEGVCLAQGRGAGIQVLRPGDPGQTIFAYTAEPNSPSHDALNLLASWSSTPNQSSAIHADEER